jgi:hypothetical protein
LGKEEFIAAGAFDTHNHAVNEIHNNQERTKLYNHRMHAGHSDGSRMNVNNSTRDFVGYVSQRSLTDLSPRSPHLEGITFERG